MLPKKGSRSICCIAFLAFLACLYFYKQLFLGLVSYADDISYFSFFDKSFYAAQVRAGVLPLWDPHVFTGIPYLGDVNRGALYPFNLLFLLASFGRALLIYHIIHLFLAGVFTFLWAKRLKISSAGSLAAAVIYMLGGVFATENIHLGYYAALAWTPLVFYSVEKWLSSGDFGSAVLAGIVMAVILLTGSPQFFLVTGYFAFFYFLLRAGAFGTPERGIPLKQLFIGAGGAILGLLVASAQLLPSFDFLRVAERPYPTDYRFAVSFSSNWRELLSTPFTRVTHGWAGVIPLMLALCGLFLGSRKRRIVVVLLSLAAVTAFLSLGDAGWLFRVFYQIFPGFGLFRAPYRFVLYMVLFLAMAAGIGADSLLNKDRPSGFWCLFCALFLVLFSAWGFFACHRMDGIWARFAFGVLWLVLAAVLIGFYNGGKIRRTAAVIGLFGLLLLDVTQEGSFLGGVHPAVSPKFYDLAAERGLINFLKKQNGFFRIYMPNDGSIPWPEYTTAGGHSFPFSPNFGESCGFENVDGYGQFQLKRQLQFLRETPAGVSLYLLNVRYIITGRDLEGAQGVKLVYKDRIARVYQLDQTGQRNFVIPTAVFHKTGAEVLAALRDPSFNPFKAVLLEGSEEEAQAPSGLASAETVYSTTLLKRTSRELVLKASLSSGGYLVSSEPYSPGWRATVDGKPAKILPAYYLLRAVYLNKGDHVVRYLYAPATFRAGLALSLSAGLLILLVTVVRWKRASFLNGGGAA